MNVPNPYAPPKTPVAVLGPPLELASPSEVCRNPGEVANRPTWALDGSPASVTVSTRVQCVPSAESYPVIVSPERVSRSQRGVVAETAPGKPATSCVKSSCIRTPWLPVTIIAAYADPGVVLALMMIPALAHGTSPGRMPGPWVSVGTWPVREVTRVVMLPFPVSGWCTK